MMYVAKHRNTGIMGSDKNTKSEKTRYQMTQDIREHEISVRGISRDTEYQGMEMPDKNID